MYESRWIVKRDAILAAAERVKQANPAAWAEVKVPGQTSRRFISLVAAECQRTVSTEVGCNLKRGGPETSLDVLAMPNQTGARDATQTFAGLELIDIIGSAESPNANISWGDVTQKTIDAGVPGGWIASADGGDGVDPEEPNDSVEPYPDEPKWWGPVFTPEIQKQYAEAGRVFPDPNSATATLDGFRWWSRTGYKIRDGMTKEAAMADTVRELRAELGL